MSVAERIEELNDGLLAAYASVETKGGTVPSEKNLDNLPAAIESISGGGAEGGPAVRFVGNDGEVISELTYEQAAELDSLPEGPEVEGLTFIGWTSTLESVNGITEPNRLDVGAMYQNAKSYGDATVLTVVPQVNSDKKITLYFTQSEADGVEIDWGDGSETETIETAGAVTAIHTYTEALADRYDIILTPTATCDLTLGTDDTTNLFGRTSSSFELKEASVGRAHLSSYVFSNCKSMTACYISPQDQILPNFTFQNCYALKYIIIPNSVTSIGAQVFYTCYNLQSIVIPDSVTSLGNSAFYRCIFQNIVIPDSVTSIGISTFSSCYNLQSIVIPDSVTSIGNSTFQNCYNLQSAVISNSVTSIGSSTFSSCYNLQNIVIPDSVTSIGGSSIQNCYALQSIVIPDSVTSIGSYTFQNCFALQSVVLSNSVTSISDSAFSSCFALQSIAIPNSITTLSGNVFQNCYLLKTVSFGNRTAKLPTFGWLVGSEKIEYLDFSECEQIPAATTSSFFYNLPTYTRIVVPDDLYDNWIVAANWSAKASQIVKASEVEEV